MTGAALILAGSRGGLDPVAAYAGVADKAMIAVDGAPMLTRVIAALREAGLAQIAVSSSSAVVAEAARALGTETLEAAAGPSLSTAEALARLGTPLLVTTADHALFRADWVRDFLADVPEGVDIAALLARRETIERDAPGTRRTYLRFADGDWSGCNLFWCATPRAAAAVELWRSIEQDRKRPWRIVRRLGPVTLLRYALGRLTLAEALDRLGALAGVCCAAVAARDGLAAVDVDKPADLDWVRARLASRAPASPSPPPAAATGGAD